HLCSTGSACLASLYDIQEGSIVDLRPTLVLIDTPDDEHIPEEPQPRSRSPSPMSRPESREVEIHTPDEEVYGLRLLQRIMTEAHLRSLSKLVVPILLIGQAIVNRGSSPQDAGSYLAGVRPVDRRLVMRCLDLGAADVILRPMHAKCVMSLEIHAHRVRKDAAKEQRAILEVHQLDIKSLTVADDKKGKEYGKVKSSGNFTFMQICGAGHMVPMDQPESSSDFFNRWLSGEWNA
ncbi:hypothetical protein BN1723_011127, partial [Verticillium longisporum]